MQPCFYGIVVVMPPWYHELEKYPLPSSKEGEEQLERPLHNKKIEAKRPPDATLDLHGMTQEQAKSALKHFLIQAYHQGWTKVLIIHGKGLHSEREAVLKQLVFRWAESHKGLRLEKAPAQWGGSGASVLYLKSEKRVKPGP
jgi:DNA-nicking Smr family endonuclease